MRDGYYAMNAILESNMASKPLCTVLRLLLDDYDKDIFTDKVGWVYVYVSDNQLAYPILKKIQILIEEAANIAIKLGMSKEAFAPVGKAMDSL